MQPESLDLFAKGKLDILMTAIEVFEEFERRVFGDTVRYRVLRMFLERDVTFSLSGLARELKLPKSSTKAFRSGERNCVGAVREAVERLVSKEIVAAVTKGEGEPALYTLNTQSPLVQVLLSGRSLRREEANDWLSGSRITERTGRRPTSSFVHAGKLGPENLTSEAGKMS